MKALSQLLKEKIDYHSRNVLEKNLLLVSGKNQMITHYQVASYVVNLEYLFAGNISTIKEASLRYQSRPILANYFHSKWMEEKGHDAWARADWVKMSKKHQFNSAPSVLSEMKDMMVFLKETMMTHPLRYIAYFYHAEYSTAILGPVWMDMIMTTLKMKKEDVSALSKHIELDGDHASEVGEFLDSLKLNQQEIEDILKFTDEMQMKYNNFFEGLWRLENAPRSQRTA